MKREFTFEPTTHSRKVSLEPLDNSIPESVQKYYTLKITAKPKDGVDTGSPAIVPIYDNDSKHK